MHLLTIWHLKLAQRPHDAITTPLLRQNNVATYIVNIDTHEVRKRLLLRANRHDGLTPLSPVCRSCFSKLRSHKCYPNCLNIVHWTDTHNTYSILKPPYYPFTHCIFALIGNKNMFNSIYTYARIYHMLNCSWNICVHMMTSSNGNIFRVTHTHTRTHTHKGQWRGALMFSVICAWTSSWANNQDADEMKFEMTSCSLWRHCIDLSKHTSLMTLTHCGIVTQDGSGSTLAQVMACGIYFKPSLYYKLNIVLAWFTQSTHRINFEYSFNL